MFSKKITVLFLSFLIITPQAFSTTECEANYLDGTSDKPLKWLQFYRTFQEIFRETREFYARQENGAPVEAKNSNDENRIVHLYLYMLAELPKNIAELSIIKTKEEVILLWFILAMKEQPEIRSAIISAIVGTRETIHEKNGSFYQMDNFGSTIKLDELVSLIKLLPEELLANFPFSQLPAKEANEILRSKSDIELLSLVGLEKEPFTSNEIQHDIQDILARVFQSFWKMEMKEEIKMTHFRRSHKRFTEDENLYDKSLQRVTPFEILVERLQEAPPKRLKKIYQKAAMKWHPDRNTKPEATERFQAIKKAYEKLEKLLYGSTG